jgi:hypothetical protein
MVGLLIIFLRWTNAIWMMSLDFNSELIRDKSAG